MAPGLLPPLASTTDASPLAAARLEMRLAEPQLSATKLAFQKHGLDPALLLNEPDAPMGTLRVERSLTSSGGGSATKRLKSSCEVNGRAVTLKALEAIVGPLVAIVDASTASGALAKPEARLAMLDAALSSRALLSSVSGSDDDDAHQQTRSRFRAAQARYRKCRRERERLENELEQRVLPARYVPSSGSNGGDGIGGTSASEQDTELLRHWVEELDQFEARLLKFCSTLHAASSSALDMDDDDDGFSDRGGLEAVDSDSSQLARVAREVAAMRWTDNFGAISASRRGRSRAVAGLSASTAFTSALLRGLTSYRDVLSNLERQLSDAQAALDAVGSLGSKQSALTAVERARDLLISATLSKESQDESPGKLAEAAERAQDLLLVVEESIADFCRCLDSDDDGLIRMTELELAQSLVSKDDVDSFLLEWSSLARKHGIAPSVLPSCHVALREELTGNVQALSLLPAAKAEEREALMEFEEACAGLSAIRRAVARQLSDSVTARLPSLGMEHAIFEARVNGQARKCTESAVYNAPAGSVSGLDAVDFVLGYERDADGPGKEAEGQVHVVASSGEKARLLLAIECTIPGSVGAACRVLGSASGAVAPPSSDERSVPPVVVLYDEIDAHVGGRAAVALARMLVDQSHAFQVVAITHNPSVAASGDVHLVVQRSKRRSSTADGDRHTTTSGISAFVSVDSVIGSARRNELARMASGDLAPTEAAIFADALIRDGSRRQTANTTVVNV